MLCLASCRMRTRGRACARLGRGIVGDASPNCLSKPPAAEEHDMNQRNDAPQRQLVAEVARALIEQVVPQEMPLFRASSAAYFKNPRRALRGQSDRDEMLGFGAGEGATFVTPIALIAATRLVEFVV